MSADLPATEQNRSQQPQTPTDRTTSEPDDDPESADEEEEDDSEDEEPKLKFTKLTGNLANVYRNGDSTSACTVVGDKMVVGSHNGNIHVLSIPTLQSLRTYRAHQASVTSVSVSPNPPPPVLIKDENGSFSVLSTPGASSKGAINTPSKGTSTSSPNKKGRPQHTAIPNTLSNQIYIATSSMDGHVCISSLLNPEDVQLRNFARPVNAVALSPNYKSDKTYLSGGLAGNLILTVGGKAGVSQDANTNSAAAAASGWLGAIGLGGNTGRDTILHGGEGVISCIKWSLSGKWVVWVNEEGIKICRSHLHLGSEDGEDAWRRVAHAERPNRREFEEMAGVWKGRCEWVADKSMEADDIQDADRQVDAKVNGNGTVKSPKKKAKIEKLTVGWGDTVWIFHVQESRASTAGRRQVGIVDMIHKMQFGDCLVSGVCFYTPTLLAILAYRTRDDDDQPLQLKDDNPADTPSRKGRQYKQTSLAPQLRLVNVANGEEVELDELSRISRFETLVAQDYHLGVLFIPPPLSDKTPKEQQRGALEGLWDAAGGAYASRIFSSSASVRSGSSGGQESTGRPISVASPSRQPNADLLRGAESSPSLRRQSVEAHPYVLQPGLKLFVQSPYDCILAVKRGLPDRLEWLLEHQQYGEAWQLIDAHPEAVSSSDETQSSSSRPSTPSRAPGQAGTLADFFADDSSFSGSGAVARSQVAQVQREKQRVADLWLQQLISDKKWIEAGKVAGKVLGTSSRWEHWVWTFAQADKFDEITPYIPGTAQNTAPGHSAILPSLVYEVVLGHYIAEDTQKLGDLLDKWDPELFDVRPVISAIEARLDGVEAGQNGSQDDTEDGDWRYLMESLARLYLADDRPKDSLRCYIRLQDAEKAFNLIREESLLDTAAQDIPGLLMLRITKEQMHTAPLSKLSEASTEAIQLLADEAHRGSLPTSEVVAQLTRQGDAFKPFLFFYFRTLWNDPASDGINASAPRRKFDMRINERHALVEDQADLAVQLFAEYSRPLLLDLLKTSSVYNYDRAAEICERRHFVPELVHILSKTGQTKRALFLIIGELGDVPQAISFTKDHPDLWDDLLDYSMNKPRFIRGLLEQVGGAVATESFNPIDVVRRIPEGLEIDGLKPGIQKLVREFEIQLSISEGVARVLRGEVGMGMDTIRAGRRKAVRFEVVQEQSKEVELPVLDVPAALSEGQEGLEAGKKPVDKGSDHQVQPGHCVGCGEPFREDEPETLIGFACGHVYHLSCLLDANPATRDSAEAEDVLRQMANARAISMEGSGSNTRSVGAKVAHAHIIGNVVKDGCLSCTGREET